MEGAPAERFVIRRSPLVEFGGVAEEAASAAYEYHDLWRRVADRGCDCVFVQQTLGRGRRVQFGGGDIATIAPEVTRDAPHRSAPSIFSDRRTVENGGTS